MINTRYARILYNSTGWVKPSGDAKEKAGYAAENGFGFEEWLLNPSQIIDEFHYSFLQPIDNSLGLLRHESELVLNIALYYRTPEGEWLWFGYINECQILTVKQSITALKHYQMQGWIDEMLNDIDRVKGNKEAFNKQVKYDPYKFLNVRFKKHDVHILPSPTIVKDGIISSYRYQLFYKTYGFDVRSIFMPINTKD